MNSAKESLNLPRERQRSLVALRAAAHSPRLYVYLASTAAALVMCWLLGKEMRWDTIDYHFYAGFSALHDRFSQDYFPAGPQSYLNPYIYVPFYLLATSGLSALGAACILAIVQSAILWLTYEIALEIAPAESPRARVGLAICAAAFAFCNPILINQFGSSYADITTAELVLAGWLLLVRAIRAPGVARVAAAALLLGVATALKATNAVHAVSAGLLVLFLPTTWQTRFRCALIFGLCLTVGVVAVSFPWSVHLERQFGNPVFPLLNGIFRSAQYPTAKMIDYRFVPDSLAEALWRPFAIGIPDFTVDDEVQAPDLRYALVLVAALALLLVWAWRRFRRSPGAASASGDGSGRPMLAVGCGLLVDWVLWLTASGNGRYFIAAACIAGVVAMALVFRLCAGLPKVRNYLVAGIFAVQLFQLYSGTYYRNEAPWDGGAWFAVQVPQDLLRRPALYLSYGIQSNSFVVPFLSPQSGFVGVAGQYPFDLEGANGVRVARLIRRYAPNLELIMPESAPAASISLTTPNAALLAFGLRADGSHCQSIVVHHEGPQLWNFKTTASSGASGQAPGKPRAGGLRAANADTGFLAVCPVVPNHVDLSAMLPGKRLASRALDRLEDACPAVFQPRRPITQYYGKAHKSDIWARRYTNTNLTAWVSDDWVKFLDPMRGGAVAYIGRESAFDGNEPLRMACGRKHEVYYAKLLSPQR